VEQKLLTPAQAWHTLQRGNERFRTGVPRHPRQDDLTRTELAHQQHPHAVVFCCSDSRVAPELIFDEGVGDLFVIRNAGQVLSDPVLGSLEYAVELLAVPLIVVIGHQECGAVAAAIAELGADAAPLPPYIARITELIKPSVRQIAGTGVTDPAAVDAAAVGRAHVEHTIGGFLAASEILSSAVANGTLAIVGAGYQLVEGRVTPDTVVGIIEERVSAQ
jgi:carbonic anhydrase